MDVIISNGNGSLHTVRCDKWNEIAVVVSFNVMTSQAVEKVNIFLERFFSPFA